MRLFSFFLLKCLLNVVSKKMNFFLPNYSNSMDFKSLMVSLGFADLKI